MSVTLTTALERIEKKCKEAKEILDRPTKAKAGKNNRWGYYLSEYHYKSSKIGKSIPSHLG